MSELIENNNVIDARPLFKVRRDSRVSTLDELETILEAEELCEEVCMSITDDIVHVVQEFGFDLSNKKLVDDISFINILVRAVIDRQLKLENPLIEDIDRAIIFLKDIAKQLEENDDNI
tara:strand:+ start:20604 stop:20960 length:357 start_codon:yes stop_codon:yes gene_type:complete